MDYGKHKERTFVEFSRYSELASFNAMLNHMIYIPRSDIGTCATDGRHLYVNEDWLYSQSMDKRIFVLAHEVCHVVFKDHVRGIGKVGIWWNISADYAINYILSKMKCIKLPSDCLYDSGYALMDAEDVYRLRYGGKPLPEDQGDGDDQGDADISDGQGGGRGNGSGSSDDLDDETIKALKDACSVSDGGVICVPMEDAVDEENRVDGITRTVDSIQQNNGGGMSGGVSERIALQRGDDVRWDWKSAMAHFVMDAKTRSDYSYARLNRRITDFRLPTIASDDGIEEFVIAIDSSGSVSGEIATKIMSVCNDLMRTYSESKFYVIHCDTDICYDDWHQYKLSDDYELKGRGCTAYAPVFDFVAEHSELKNIAGLVYITDGDIYAEMPIEAPKFPVLWFVVQQSYYRNDFDPDFGKTSTLYIN